MPTTMRAIRLAEASGPEALRLEAIPVPVAGEGETLVRVRAAALNHRDVYVTQGKYPGIALPVTLGSDGAGLAGEREVVIDPMLGWGDDDRVWQNGASILGMPRDGTFAEYVAVPSENVHAKPAHLSMEEAAGLPLAGLTAYRALFTRGGLSSGETVLITGVGGGVQTFVLLFAKAAGARAVVTSGSDEKLARARELGADVTINYRTDEAWHKSVRKAGPVDLAIDSAGGATLGRCVESLRPGGRVVLYGGSNGDANLRPFSIFWNHIDVLGTSMGSPRDFAAMLAFVERERIRPAIDRVYRLDEIVAAATRLDGARQFGKIVLSIE
ncbi:MAG: NAD(P)-dependent alcohol dehydrogenase [Candidatus Eremiobacteraeota bacterium]|nr:NAD(P)-dependent alcohol dehydrogenase [Candidatus Eremiobacteraeota bacterium]